MNCQMQINSSHFSYWMRIILIGFPIHTFSLQANQKGTASSKKKKKAKLQRVMRSMKRQQRRASGNCSWGSYTPLTHLKDPQVS